jgi:hypothetical protein
MRIFFIRNTLSLALAESIICKYNYRDSVAIVQNPPIFNKSSCSATDSINSLIRKKLWSAVYLFPNYLFEDQVDYSNIILLNLSFRRVNRINIINFMSYIENLFQNEITDVYLTYPERYLDERILFTVSRKKKIKINLIDEGYGNYLSIIKKPLIKMFAIKIKRVLVLFLDLVYYFRFFGFGVITQKDVSDFYFDVHYSLTKLSTNRIRSLDREVLNVFDYLTYPNIYQIDHFYISRPMSEDGFMSLDREISVIRELIESINDLLYIKFHPRENKTKIDLILNIEGVKALPYDSITTTSEMIVGSGCVKNIYGYFSNTMFLAMEYGLANVYTLLDYCYEDRILEWRNLMYTRFPEKFENIRFNNEH